eukprot:4178726-Pyramimonas_sp.AAC.1
MAAPSKSSANIWGGFFFNFPGNLNSPVVERLNKGLTVSQSPIYLSWRRRAPILPARLGGDTTRSQHICLRDNNVTEMGVQRGSEGVSRSTILHLRQHMM